MCMAIIRGRALTTNNLQFRSLPKLNPNGMHSKGGCVDFNRMILRVQIMSFDLELRSNQSRLNQIAANPGNISYFPIIIYSQVTDHLFDSEFSGEDLIAINIQRSRDNGIKGYVEYRSICRPELGKATKFQVHSHA